MYEAATSFGEVGAGLGMSPTSFLGVLSGLDPYFWHTLRSLAEGMEHIEEAETRGQVACNNHGTT